MALTPSVRRHLTPKREAQQPGGVAGPLDIDFPPADYRTTVSAVSSMKKLVCSDESSVPLK